MIIKRVVRNENGEIEATLMLTPEQAAFLINTGLGFLVQTGVASVADMSVEEFEAERATQEQPQQSELPLEAGTTVSSEQAKTAPTEADKQKAFLASIDINSIPKA